METVTGISEKRTLIDALAATAKSSPDQVAFQCATATVTYAELLQRSMQLSAYFDSRGVTHQEPIALLMPRCVESSIAAYGTMYGGRIWVPIDPSSPVAAVRQMLIDCGISVLVTHPKMAHLVQRIVEQENPLHTLVGVDTNAKFAPSLAITSWPQLSKNPIASQLPQASAEDVAYIIHTSGSTGRPKGIVHTHSSGSSYARLSVNTFDLCSTDVIGIHGPLHTDMCTLGMLAGPLAGATAQIVPDAHVKVPASLSALMESSRISVWYSVPQVLVQLLTAGVLEARDLSQLRWVIYAGEALAPSRILELLRFVPNAKVCNVYGPAETNQCMHYVVQNEKELEVLVDQNRQVPIGEAWPETKALLLDEHDNIVGPEVTGELVVHSSTLMQEYWHDDRSVDAIFFQNPEDQTSYYRTGDLARRDTEGVYTLIGRRGRQVKVRGMRVELDAIELLLSQHTSVVDAVAIAHQTSSDPGSCVIRAYVTQSGDSDSENLHDYIRRRMPAHAVPESIQVRSSLPLTSGGKIDRLCLSAEICA